MLVNSWLVTYASTATAISKFIRNPAAVVVHDSQVCDLSRNPEAGDVDLGVIEIVYVDVSRFGGCIGAAE